MNIKKINFDLFHLTTRNDDHKEINFVTLLEEGIDVFQSTFKDSGPIDMINIPHKYGPFYAGALGHTHMNNLPSTFDIQTKQANPLILADTAGLNYPTAFLFDPALKILVFESSLNGVNLNSFCTFYEINYNVKLDASFVLDPAEIVRLQSMTRIASADIRIAKLQNGNILEDQNLSTAQLVKAADNTNADSINIELNAGLGNSLNKNYIIDMVKKLLPHKQNNELIRLKITGREEDNKSQSVLDLITGRIRIEIAVERKRHASDISLADKMQKVVEKYQKLKPNLDAAYGNKQ